MQKTTIKYYCDKCGKEIKKVMFWYESRSRFYTEKCGKFVETIGQFDDGKHYCLECAEPIINALGMEMSRTQALLEEDENV